MGNRRCQLWSDMGLEVILQEQDSLPEQARPGTSYEFPGSGVSGAFVDRLVNGSNNPTGLIHGSLNSDVAGRYLFAVNNGIPGQPLIDGPAVHVEPGLH